MPSTTQFGLPLLAAAQAQKHVTVNEALSRLDAAAQLRVVSSNLTTPPGSPAEGAAYLVPAGATGAWASQAGQVAVSVNGAWVFLVPRAGWRLWDEAAPDWYMFDGVAWQRGALVVSAGGAGTSVRVIEIDHTLSSGSTDTVSAAIPAFAQVTGVTGRVISAISGASAWSIGVPSDTVRYGQGLGTGLNSFLTGLSGTPVTYYATTDLVLTASGGDFTGGSIRIAVHMTELSPPRAV